VADEDDEEEEEEVLEEEEKAWATEAMKAAFSGRGWGQRESWWVRLEGEREEAREERSEWVEARERRAERVGRRRGEVGGRRLWRLERLRTPIRTIKSVGQIS
jgi:hypothetical protein